MKSQFYTRTAYRMFMQLLPKCFLDLDTALAPGLATADDMVLNPSVRQGERLCRRMAEVDYYAVEIAKKMVEYDTDEAAIESEVLLVGYMSSCKAVFDAAAIVLTQIFALQLDLKQQDMRHRAFRRELKNTDAAAAGRYAAFNNLIGNEVVPWRDAVIHRETPTVVPRSDGVPFSGDKSSKVALAHQLDAEFSQLLQHPEIFSWVDPLHFHRRWRGPLDRLCTDVCNDILSHSGGASPPVSAVNSKGGAGITDPR